LNYLMQAARPTLCVIVSSSIMLTGCGPRPTHDAAKLQEIASAAQTVLASHPAGAPQQLPPNQLPQGITRLHPQLVIAEAEGLEIVTKPYFDGGWGYYVRRPGRELPQPKARFSELGTGVYWFHPY
jgi:hypothetical protein